MKPQAPGITIKLKTADPTIVPVPISLSDINTPITDVKSSGAEVPIAINVAPAISGGRLKAREYLLYVNKFVGL